MVRSSLLLSSIGSSCSSRISSCRSLATLTLPRMWTFPSFSGTGTVKDPLLSILLFARIAQKGSSECWSCRIQICGDILARFLEFIEKGPVLLKSALIKKKIKVSSYIGKFRREELQSHMGLTASSYMVNYLPFLIYYFATAPI